MPFSVASLVSSVASLFFGDEFRKYLKIKDYFNIIYKEALENGMSKDAIFCLPSARDALRKAQELTDKDDIVLIENRVNEAIIKGLTL